MADLPNTEKQAQKIRQNEETEEYVKKNNLSKLQEKK